MLVGGGRTDGQAAMMPAGPASGLPPPPLSVSCPNNGLVFPSMCGKPPPDPHHMTSNMGLQNRQALPPIQSLYQVYSKSMEDNMRVATQKEIPQNHLKIHPSVPVPVPLWLHHYNMANVQQVMNEEKALLASHMAASNPYFNFGMLGQYAATKKLYRCPQCRYFTDRKNNLKRHVATMHQECDKMLECCGVVFKNKAALKDHVLIFHSTGYMCRYCGRNFCRKALLKRHMTVHSGQKDYTCPDCDYATSHKSNLERHKKVHERQPEGSEMTSNETGSPRHSESSVTSTSERMLNSDLRSDGGSSGTEEENNDLIDVLELDEVAEDEHDVNLTFDTPVNFDSVSLLANPLQRNPLSLQRDSIALLRESNPAKKKPYEE